MMFFLRPEGAGPINFSKFMIKIQSDKQEYLLDLKVKEPNKLIIFGYFLGLKGFDHIHKFHKEHFEDEIKYLAEEHLSRKLVIKDDSKLIIADKLISWLIEDFQDNSLYGILEYFSN
jgi:hypothetical protein